MVEKRKKQKQKTKKKKKIPPIEKQNWGERERELTYFVVDNLEGIEERGGNEIIRNLYKN